MVAYLEDHPCRRCGFSDPRALDFHHREPDQKVKSVSRMITDRTDIGIIFEEIEKCDVLCSNCHRILHAEERGNYR